MKRGGWIILLFAAAGARSCLAAGVEVTLSGGYQGGGSFAVEGGEAYLPAAPSLSVIVNVTVRENAQIEVSLSRQSTELRRRPGALAPSETLMELAIEYYQVGGLLEWPAGRLRPFFAMTVGGTRLAPEPTGIDSSWRFSGILEGGTKIDLGRRLALRAQGRLLLPWLGGSSTIFCSLPGGCLVSLEGTVLVQGDVSLGLVAVF